MIIEEKIYFRESLGVKCSSLQLAYSYLEGRVGKNEVFSLDGIKLNFSDIFLQDEMVRNTVREYCNSEELFPEQHKFDSFSERYKLFQKIVLRGDDSIAPLLVELEEKRDQIIQQQKDLQSRETQLSCWKKNNDDLVDACKNAYYAIQHFGIAIEAQKKSLSPGTVSFTEYSEMLTIIKQLTDDLRSNLQNNIVAGTVSDSSTALAIEYINIIEDFRKTTHSYMEELKASTELKAEKKMAELAALEASTKQELADQREKENRKIEDDRMKLELYKESEFRDIAETRKKHSDHIAKLKACAIDEIKAKSSELTSLMNTAGELEEAIRSEAKIWFSGLGAMKRCYVFPKIPNSILYSSIKWCRGEVAPKSVIAVFDCSLLGNGSSGILVSTHAFYLFNQATIKRYQLHRSNTIAIELGKPSIWRAIWIAAGIVSVVLAVPTGGLSLFGLPSFFFAFLCRGTISVKHRDQSIMSFPNINGAGIEKFRYALNQLCSSCNLTKEQIAQIERIMW